MKHILVIDDEPSYCRILTQILEASDYKVRTTLSGEEGVRLYREEPADLVIVDIFMPKMDGLEVIHNLKEEFPDVKLIAVSGGGSLEMTDCLQVAKELGAQRVFQKPVRSKLLLQTIEELLDVQT